LVGGRACCAAFHDGSRSALRVGQEAHGGVTFLSLRLSDCQRVVLRCCGVGVEMKSLIDGEMRAKKGEKRVVRARRLIQEFTAKAI
jgi:hypothetical protein